MTDFNIHKHFWFTKKDILFNLLKIKQRKKKCKNYLKQFNQLQLNIKIFSYGEKDVKIRKLPLFQI